MDFGRNSEADGTEARVDTGGDRGDDESGLDIEIDRPIGLLVNEEQAVIQSAMYTLMDLGPAAFWQLTAAAIEVLGRSCWAHHGAIAILIAGWGSLVNPSARAAMRPTRDGRACHRDSRWWGSQVETRRSTPTLGPGSAERPPICVSSLSEDAFEARYLGQSGKVQECVGVSDEWH
jgi:hypothetical protein